MGVWNDTLPLADVWHNDDMTWEQKRDTAAERIKCLPHWGHDDELEQLVEEMEDCDTVSWFDQVWDAFYDWADAERVWVETF